MLKHLDKSYYAESDRIHWLFLGLLGCIVILGAVTATLTLRSMPLLAAQPIIDDGFYAMAIARNIGLGHGITIDGELLTNGFQPLVVFLTAPLYAFAGADRVLAIRLVLAFHWMIYTATGFVLGLIVSDYLQPRPSARRAFVIATTMFLHMVSMQIIMQYFNGLETGLVLLLYALAWRYYQQGYDRTYAGVAGLGGLLGLLVLARIDAAVFVALFTLYYLLKHWSAGVVPAFARAALLGTSALLVSSPWWLFNVTQFGAILPTSGQALSITGTSIYLSLSDLLHRLMAAFEAVFENTMPLLFAGRYEDNTSLFLLLRVGMTVALVYLLWRARAELFAVPASHPQSELRRRTLIFGLLLLVAFLVLVGYYGALMVSTWFYTRYLTLGSLLAVATISLVVYHYWSRLKVVFVAVGTVLFIYTTAFVLLGHMGRSLTESYWDQVAVTFDNVPPDEAVAAVQTGTLGYFRDHVINLDGKVNTDVAPYIHDETVWLYLENEGIRWVVDGEYLIPLIFDASPEAHGWSLVEQRGNYLLYHHDDAGTGE